MEAFEEQIRRVRALKGVYPARLCVKANCFMTSIDRPSEPNQLLQGVSKIVSRLCLRLIPNQSGQMIS
jgi:hypothetical protein